MPSTTPDLAATSERGETLYHDYEQRGLSRAIDLWDALASAPEDDLRTALFYELADVEMAGRSIEDGRAWFTASPDGIPRG